MGPPRGSTFCIYKPEPRALTESNCPKGCTLAQGKAFPQIGRNYLTDDTELADELRLTQCPGCGRVWQLYRDSCRRFGRDPWHGGILKGYQ